MDNSLVFRIDVSDGAPRFGMLETIREFGLEQLDAGGEADAVRQETRRIGASGSQNRVVERSFPGVGTFRASPTDSKSNSVIAERPSCG